MTQSYCNHCQQLLPVTTEKTITVFNVDVSDSKFGTSEQWTLQRVLEYINQDRSCDWNDYDASDWVEGWAEWVEPNGIYSILGAFLRDDYFH